MEIKKIHSMTWSEDGIYVVLFADTNEGDNLQIATPYNETSIIWDAVRAFPVDQIQPYVAPVEEVQDVEFTE
jgi:hypothetical protein